MTGDSSVIDHMIGTWNFDPTLHTLFNIPELAKGEVTWINKPWRRGTSYPALGGVVRDEAIETSQPGKTIKQKTIELTTEEE